VGVRTQGNPQLLTLIKNEKKKGKMPASAAPKSGVVKARNLNR
jgi:hypothetical protein